ncbi:MAG: hypothetical protein KKF89_01125 [Nanoarchaeota archaeon]|nr:hypothetical protein [Nanoarchaeota archaeon]MBU1854300.1 hypothetical protein [Nanoarchaeota archaeon]
MTVNFQEMAIEELSLNNTIKYIIQSVIDGRNLSENEKIELKNNFDQRSIALERENNQIFRWIKRNQFKNTNFREIKVHNLEEKLDILFSKSTIPRHILEGLEKTHPKMVSEINAYRQISGKKKEDDPKMQRLRRYPVDLTLYTRNKMTGGLYLAIKKNSKIITRLAGKGPRYLVRERVTREAAGEENSDHYLIDDCKLGDFAGILFVSVQSYGTSNNAVDNIKWALSTSTDIDVVNIENYFTNSKGYDAMHLDVKFDPKRFNHDYTNEDTLEIQLMGLPTLLSKEIDGPYSQCLFIHQQAQFRDRRLTPKQQNLVTEKDKAFVVKAETTVLQVLTYNQYI